MAEPKVRFKKDGGSSYPAWEQGRFGDLIEVYDEKVTSDCTLPVLTSSKTDGIQYQSDHFGREQLHDITGYNVIPRGYCTYRNRSDGTDFTFNINNLCDRGIVSKFYPVFHTTARCNLYFLMTLMNNESKTVRKIAMTAKGTGQKVLSFLDLQKIEINIPSLEEQQKIADFLSSVDEVITASEQEVANLETQKKAVMKKVFSQEVRFKRTDGTDFSEWGKQTLGNLAEFSKGQGYTKSDLSETGSPIILYGRLYTKYQTVISEVDTFAEMKPRSVLSKKGDVIVPASGETAEDISVAAVVDVDGIILGGDLNIIHPCNAILPDYLAYALTFGTPHQEMAKRAQGKSIVHLRNDDLKSAVIVYPCIEEQRLIADFLSDFDDAIAAAKKELELWKELKKGLLQQLFM